MGLIKEEHHRQATKQNYMEEDNYSSSNYSQLDVENTRKARNQWMPPGADIAK